VNGDATRLAQILDNLLSNAMKFSKVGGEVSLRRLIDEHNEQAVVVVTDTGIGIERQWLPQIFDTFFRADRSLDRSRGGLGLGLALVKCLVELHGGSINAASDGPGRGARFTIRLPLEKEPPAVLQRPAFPTPAKDRLRVLVVEDNADSAESLR
jgi:signal transduction histidine kinase